MKINTEKIISALFEKWSGHAPEQIIPIAAAGSPRKYFRLSGQGVKAVGAYNPDLKENEAFITFTRHFYDKGLPVPELLAADKEAGIYMVSDLGNDVLFDHIIKRKDWKEIPDDLYAKLAMTVRMLPHFQVEGAQGMDWSVCYPRETFDMQSMMWDLNYFKYYILKTAGITFNEQLLENDFLRFAEFLLQAGQEHFLYRDFQSRNVMLVEDKPYFIDYQGGRKGPLQYDLASFLYQVKAHFPEETRDRLIDEYLEELSGITSINRDLFMKYYFPFVYLRLFQVLGAYGFRGLFEHRPHFADSLEPALASLARLLNRHPLEPELTELKSALRKLTQSSKYLPVHHERASLTVSINSFSYLKGIPEDKSEHGGGFVFDCRSLPNPGRLEKYKHMNGRDREVIEFLDRYRESDNFLHHVFALCDSAVENYIERKFTDLSVSFGCTGGQHRSVYFADRLAEHLSGKYVVNVKIHHREQNILENKPG